MQGLVMYGIPSGAEHAKRAGRGAKVCPGQAHPPGSSRWWPGNPEMNPPLELEKVAQHLPLLSERGTAM